MQFLGFRHAPLRVLGDHVFWWTPLAPDGKGSVGWLLCFYAGELVLGITGGSFKPDGAPVKSGRLLNKGKREGYLKRVIDRGLVVTPPDDYLEFLYQAIRRGKK